jgi:hypothetical protein
LPSICHAISSATHIPEDKLKNENLSSSRNRAMLKIFYKVGANLSALRNTKDFYSFLGTDGEKIMDEILVLLTEKK